MACITEGSAGFPGFSARIPFENGTIAEVLNEQGWNTYAVGKWHLTPADEIDLSAWKARWPLGRGFERYYGFLGGETNQWYPDLVYDNHTVAPPASPEEGYHLSRDLTDKAIEFIRDSKAVAPDKPWYMYFCPGCGTRPAPRLQGVGGQVSRAASTRATRRSAPTILANQKQLGLLPAETELSPINPHGEPDVTGPAGQPWPLLDFVRPWDSLSDEEKRLFARMAEVFAGFVSYTDDQIGRLIDYLDESGQLENTIIMVVSDNGSSGEGGPNGSFNENKFFNNVPDSVEANLARLDDLGGPSSYNHYNTGWAWAFDTPFPYWKRFAGYEGGVVGHPARLLAEGDRRARRSARPVRPRGRPRPDDYTTCSGSSRRRCSRVTRRARSRARASRPRSPTRPRPGARRSSTRCSGCARSTTRAGSRTLCTRRSPAGGSFDLDEWELYNLAEDRAQIHNLAAEHPERLEELKGLWWYYAGIYKGLPLDDRDRARDHLGRAAAAERAARPLRLLPGRGRGAGVGLGQRPAALVHDCGGGGPQDARGRGRAVLAGRSRRRPRSVPEGRAAALHLQLARREGADDHLRRRGAQREPRPHGGVPEDR